MGNVEEIDKKLSEIENNLIDFNQVQKTFKNTDAVDKVTIIPNNIIVSEFTNVITEI